MVGSSWYSETHLLKTPIKNIEEKYALLPAFLEVRNIVKQHLDSYNHFIDHNLREIITTNQNMRITCNSDPSFYLKYTAIHIGKPCLQEYNSLTNYTTPQQCRLRDMTYAAPITVDVEYTRAREVIVKNGLNRSGAVYIGRMPIMLKSNRCVLNGRKEEELAKLGECPLDPGGYFIIRGVEKVILMQEQLVKNRVIVNIDTNGMPMASVTSSTHKRKSKTTLLFKHGCIYVKLSAFNDLIPVVVVFKAIGIESDQEIMSMVTENSRLGELFVPSFLDCKKITKGIFNTTKEIKRRIK